jgi:hypothetical protein
LPKAFHRQRRMFAIIKGKIEVAPTNDERSHTEWFNDMGWLSSSSDPEFENIVRGFSDDRGLFAYKGSGFCACVQDEIIPRLIQLRESLGLTDEAFVFLGAHEASRGLRWQGKEVAGQIGALIEARPINNG